MLPKKVPIFLLCFLFGFPVIVGIFIYNMPEKLIEFALNIFEIVVLIESFLTKICNYSSELENITTVYDYIIVGAGTAGSLIAAKLSLNSNNTVLVLEAGTNPSIFQKIPALSPLFHETQYNWKYKSEPQTNSCGAMKKNECNFPVGKGLGGSGLINNMIWHRGIASDYADWFNDKPYNYEKDIEHFFITLERKLQPKSLNYVTTLSEKLLNMSDSNNIRFIKPLVLQNVGKRFTTYDYASKTITANTKFVTDAVVKRINFNTKNEMQSSGVTFEKNNKLYTIISRQGVILSAGSIGTPKILLQSGIGPCNELEELNIKCLKNIPMVGRNLQDHIATGMSLFQFNESLNMNILNLLQPDNILKYFNPFKFGNGPLSTVGCELLGFSKDNRIGFMFMPVDITSDYGIKLRHVMNIKEEIWENYFRKLMNVQTISILPILLHPKSKGFVKLKRIDSDFEIIINPQYFIEKTDLEELLKGIYLIKSFISKIKETKNINLKIVKHKIPGCDNLTIEDDYWKCYIKKLSFSIYHPIGTCKMGSNINNSVIDYNFKVHNINGLFIVDASVMPNLPSGNPNSAVALLTEKFLEIHKNIV